MAKTYRTSAKSAHPHTDTRVGKARQACRLNAAESAVAVALWPHKPAANWSLYAGVAIRRAEDWLAGRKRIGDEAWDAMLAGAHGFKFLAARMSTVSPAPAWWRGFKRQIEIAELRQAQQATSRRLAALEAGTLLDEEFPS